MSKQPKIYTMMPVPVETVTSTDLAEAVKIATTRAQETKTSYGIFVNLNHLASFGKGINQSSVGTNKSSVGIDRSGAEISNASMRLSQSNMGINKPSITRTIARYIARYSNERSDGYIDGHSDRYSDEHLEEQRSIFELTSEVERLNRLVCRDPLTGLYNSRYLRHRLSTEFKRAKRDCQPLSCCMLDVDRFKLINDTYGHPAGDCALKSLGFFLRRKLRETDIVTRYGGDEFCILLPNTFFDQALMVMNKIRRQTAEHLFRINAASTDAASRNGIGINMSISFGLASIQDDDICQPAQLIERADKSLYQAKTDRSNIKPMEKHGHPHLGGDSVGDRG